MPVPLSKKICLIGDFAVGKTSLVRRYVDRQFSDSYLSTVGVKISRKLLKTAGIPPADTIPLQLMIWDIEGSDAFKTIEPSYLRGASGAIVVADLSRQTTGENIGRHIQHFLRVNPSSFVVVALNKADLIAAGTSLPSRGLQDIDRVLEVCVTSARSGEGVETAFETLASALMEH